MAERVEAARLVEVAVEGWPQPGFMIPGTKVPRRMADTALLVPFDPLIWARDRTERLFDFFYRIEIYVPEPKRIHGYYVLPFLLGDQLVARVDLKADRKASTLRVIATHAEAHASPAKVAAALAGELSRMARWLELEKVAVERRGDLAQRLGRSLRSLV